MGSDQRQATAIGLNIHSLIGRGSASKSDSDQSPYVIRVEHVVKLELSCDIFGTSCISFELFVSKRILLVTRERDEVEE